MTMNVKWINLLFKEIEMIRHIDIMNLYEDLKDKMDKDCWYEYSIKLKLTKCGYINFKDMSLVKIEKQVKENENV